MECPMCGKLAEIVIAPGFDGTALKCPDHDVFEVSGTASVTLRAASYEYWQAQRERARAVVMPGEFPIIVDPSLPVSLEYLDKPVLIG